MGSVKQELEMATRGEGTLGRALAKDPEMTVFVLAATDAFAMELVELWVIRARAAGTPNPKIQSAINDFEQMQRYPYRKIPD